jgi:hypothetical protein
MLVATTVSHLTTPPASTIPASSSILPASTSTVDAVTRMVELALISTRPAASSFTVEPPVRGQELGQRRQHLVRSLLGDDSGWRRE